MKPTLLILIGCLAVACSPSITRPQAKCLDLTGLTKISTVTFEVNSPKYDKYKRHYLIQVYENDKLEKLVDNVLLSRTTDWRQTIPVQSNYCILVFKDRTLTTYSQMDWEKPGGRTSMIDQGQKTYYASAKRGAFFLFSPPINSKDGAAGDGVRAVLN